MTDKLVKIAICWFANAILLYLGGAFMAASFDISTWDEMGCSMAGLLWIALSAAAVPAILIGEDFI